MNTDINNCNDTAWYALNQLTALDNQFISIFMKNNATLITDFAFFNSFAAIATALSDALNDK